MVNPISLVESFSWQYGAFLLALMFTIIALVGVVIVRKVANFKVLKAHHDVAGVVFTNLGVLYAVLLGFTVVNVQQRFDKIKEISQVESGILADLFRDAEVFQEKDRIALRKALRNYVENVITKEWPSMASGAVHLETSEQLHNIWNVYYQMEIRNEKDKIWYAQSISRLNDLMNSRLARLIGSRESLGDEMWTLLIFGGIVMVIFIWFFGFEKIYLQILMATVLATSTSFLLFLIYSLDTIFTGTVSIAPSAMLNILKSFNH